MKFTDESHFSLGCTMVKLLDGTDEGRRCDVFVYSGKWVRMINEWEDLVAKEIAWVRALPGVGGPWITRQHINTDDGISMVLPPIGNNLFKSYDITYII